MEKKGNEPAPGDGLRSLKSTMLFRAVNYELYVKPNKVIMAFGVIAMLGCTAYLLYMNRDRSTVQYYSTVQPDGSIALQKKTSKWSE
ncbi:hypothetical protein KM043_006179 [Ampulex compressa]|nr:hypothetical protein KM043_006179 [Ampulex compressa]